MKNLVVLIAACLLLMHNAYSQISFGKEYQFFQNEVMNVTVFTQPDGYIMATAAPLHVNDYHLTLIKTDLNGDTLWIKYYDVGINTNWSYVSGDSDAEGNMYIVVNNAEYNLVKINPSGDLLWQKYYDDMISVPLYGNNFLWACFREEGSNVCYLYKINPVNGGAAWRTVIFNDSGSPGSMDIKEEGEIAVLVVDNYQPPYSMRLFIKPSDSATFTSVPVVIENNSTVLHGLRYSGDELWSFAEYPSNGNPHDYLCFVRLLTTGEILLQQPFSFNAIASGVNNMIINNNQQIIFTCNAYFNSYADSTMLLCMDMNGEILWNHTLPDISFAIGLGIAEDGGYVVSGECSHLTDNNPFLYKTDPQGVVSVKKTSQLNSLAKIYPNPSNGTITFEVPGIQKGEIIISDLSGRFITHTQVINGMAVWNTSSFSPGVYLYRTGNGLCGKLIVAK